MGHYKIQTNVKLSPVGRKDWPRRTVHSYPPYPIGKLKVGDSFVADETYEYGKTITVKNKCRRLAKKIGVEMSFAVREWKGKIRVWRVK